MNEWFRDGRAQKAELDAFEAELAESRGDFRSARHAYRGAAEGFANVALIVPSDHPNTRGDLTIAAVVCSARAGDFDRAIDLGRRILKDSNGLTDYCLKELKRLVDLYQLLADETVKLESAILVSIVSGISAPESLHLRVTSDSDPMPDAVEHAVKNMLIAGGLDRSAAIECLYSAIRGFGFRERGPHGRESGEDPGASLWKTLRSLQISEAEEESRHTIDQMLIKPGELAGALNRANQLLEARS